MGPHTEGPHRRPDRRNHDALIEEAEALCDRVGVLSKGRLMALDSPAGLKTRVGKYVVDL